MRHALQPALNFIMEVQEYVVNVVEAVKFAAIVIIVLNVRVIFI
jgi:hypothetical protein